MYQSKLSKQQRFILKILRNGSQRSIFLSYKVANKFDNSGSRIEIVVDGDYRLTAKHRASMSRSLKRLEDRGLIAYDWLGYHIVSEEDKIKAKIEAEEHRQFVKDLQIKNKKIITIKD